MLRFEAGNIVVNDVTAILAQVCRNAVGTGRNGNFGSPDRVGMAPATRIAHCSDVVDVDAEADDGRSRHVSLARS